MFYTALTLAFAFSPASEMDCHKAARINEPACIVAMEESDKYDIVLLNDDFDPDALCVQAGITAIAYLQARDALHYSIWKKTERSNCADAQRLKHR